MLAAALHTGCGAKKVAAPRLHANVPEQVVQVSPPARSAHVLTDTPIWARFDRALDPATVNSRTVFLKVDTQRRTIAVAWDATNLRILVTPQQSLSLLTTYTVEFAPGIATLDGDSLGQTYFWQFTTNGIRRPRAPFPPDRALDESPFATLLWVGTELSAGTIKYDLYAGPDSDAVASHSLPALAHPSTETYMPIARWWQDRPVFWTLHVTNVTAGEELDGPVWRFDPVPGTTPVDTVVVPVRDWFWGYPYTTASGRPGYYANCKGPELRCGAIDALMRWDFSSLGPGLRLAGAGLDLTLLPGYVTNPPPWASLGGVKNDWTVCVMGFSYPYVLPKPSVDLATGEVLPASRLRFATDRLAAYIESMVRHGGHYAMMFDSYPPLSFYTPVSAAGGPQAPQLKVQVYRLGGTPDARPSAAEWDPARHAGVNPVGAQRLPRRSRQSGAFPP